MRLQWAKRQAHEYNAAFDTKGVPFEAEDFIGTGTRAKRILDQERSKLLADRANRVLSTITRDTRPEDVEGLPSWAFGRKAG